MIPTRLVYRADRYATIREGLKARGYRFPDRAGDVSAGPPRLGALYLPDNMSSGSLEDVLLDCASKFTRVCCQAPQRTWIQRAGTRGLLPEELREVGRPAGRNKAIIGCMANMLRPGRAVQNSIQDNRWLRRQSSGASTRSRGPGVPDESVGIALRMDPTSAGVTRAARYVGEPGVPLRDRVIAFHPWLEQ